MNQIVEEEGPALDTTATPQFISALADLVYSQAGRYPSLFVRLTLESLALDLESFASHAKRSIINVEDVKVRHFKMRKLTNSYAAAETKDWFVKRLFELMQG